MILVYSPSRIYANTRFDAWPHGGNGFGDGWYKWFHFVRVGRKNGFVWQIAPLPFPGFILFRFGASGSRSAGLLLATRREFGQPMTADSIVAREEIGRAH